MSVLGASKLANFAVGPGWQNKVIFPVTLNQRTIEITHDPLLFSVAQGIF
jgi:hypothetical protein